MTAGFILQQYYKHCYYTIVFFHKHVISQLLSYGCVLNFVINLTIQKKNTNLNTPLPAARHFNTYMYNVTPQLRILHIYFSPTATHFYAYTVNTQSRVLTHRPYTTQSGNLTFIPLLRKYALWRINQKLIQTLFKSFTVTSQSCILTSLSRTLKHYIIT